MLDTLCNQANQIQNILIQQGLEISPTCTTQTNKIKQLHCQYELLSKQIRQHMNLKQQSQSDKNNTLFRYATETFWHCSAKYYIIENLVDLLDASQHTLYYIKKYR